MLRVRVKINAVILIDEAPSQQGAKIKEYLAYSVFLQHSWVGCIGDENPQLFLREPLGAAKGKRPALFERSEFAGRPQRTLAALKPLWRVLQPDNSGTPAIGFCHRSYLGFLDNRVEIFAGRSAYPVPVRARWAGHKD